MDKQRGFTPLEMKSSNRGSKRFLTGFTLIELLMVIAIIALLMSMLMPALARVRRLAKSIVCQSTLRQWGTTLLMYTHDNDGSLPNGAAGPLCDDCENPWDSTVAPFSGGCDGTWIPRLLHYWTASEKLTVLCPMATKTKDEGAYPPYRVAGPPFIESRTSYGWNSWFNDPPEIDCWGGSPGKSNYYIKLDKARPADRIPVLADATHFGDHPGHFDDPPDPQGVYSGGAMSLFTMDRHDGGTNMLFADISVRKMNPKCMWRCKWGKDFDLKNLWTVQGGVQPEDWAERAPWMVKFPECLMLITLVVRLPVFKM